MKRRAQQIEKVILENISDYNFSVEILAEKLNISTSHLRETVNRFFFMSPHKLIESVKLQKAILMFCKGASIELVKREIGYINSRTFRRVFKKRLHCTPNGFQKIVLNKSKCSDSLIEPLLSKLWEIKTTSKLT